MVVHSFYIFNRNCECVHSQKWQHYHQQPKELSEEEEQKLIFGVVFSIKGLVKKIAGEWVNSLMIEIHRSLSHHSASEQFQSFKTSRYRLHVYESPSGFKFVLIMDQNTTNMSSYLQAIYAGPFNSAVVRNPLVSVADGVLSTDKLRREVELVVRSIR